MNESRKPPAVFWPIKPSREYWVPPGAALNVEVALTLVPNKSFPPMAPSKSFEAFVVLVVVYVVDPPSKSKSPPRRSPVVF